MDAYTDSLLNEIPDAAFDTVFVGGGTPSVLPYGKVASVLKKANAKLSREVTIEANPGTLDNRKLDEYLEAGVNRLSLGAQSLNDDILRRLGRIHTADDTYKAVLMARAAGFSNINLDLMYDLPGQTPAMHAESMRAAALTGVEHISMYSLILEEGTPLWDDVSSGREHLPDSDDDWAMEQAGRQVLANYGFARYEVSNYAREGFECLHNLNYWNGGDYTGVGLGASGSSWLGGTVVRTRNTVDLDAYIRGENEREVITETGKDAELTYIMMALRLTKGFPVSEFERRFGKSFSILSPDIIHEDGFIRLTKRGMDVMNAVLEKYV